MSSAPAPLSHKHTHTHTHFHLVVLKGLDTAVILVETHTHRLTHIHSHRSSQPVSDRRKIHLRKRDKRNALKI